MPPPFTAFDLQMFWDEIAWTAPVDGSETHGDPILPDTGPPIVQPCFVEPTTTNPGMMADHGMPESSKLYNVHTGTDPAIGLHWLGTWQGKRLRALEPTEQHSSVFFRTVCVLVT